jgi:hypothetical protein
MLIGRDSFAELDHDLGNDVGGDFDCGVAEDGLPPDRLEFDVMHLALITKRFSNKSLQARVSGVLQPQLVIDTIRNRVIHVSMDLDPPEFLVMNRTRLMYDLHPDVTTGSESTSRPAIRRRMRLARGARMDLRRSLWSPTRRGLSSPR